MGGWTYAPWRGPFYPPGLRQADELAHAAGRLSAIEVNGTFYRTQTRETFARWAAATPEDFRFTLKAPRHATSRRVLADAGDSVRRFVGSGIAELGPRLAAVNWQFGPGKVFDPDDFAAFLALLPQAQDGVPLHHAVEVRHPSFETPAFAALAGRHGVAVVQAGDSGWPRIEAPTPGLAYLRIMGSRPGGYPEERLAFWAAEARRLAAAGRSVFLFVIGGHKVDNPAAALRLIELVSRAPPATPRA